MKSIPLGRLLVSCIAGTATYAQSASTSESSEPVKSDKVVLSPFQVTATQEGYATTETLAGTRFKSNLADVSSSITVFTSDLLKDIGATDLESMINFMPNTESFTVDAALDTVGNGARYGTQYRVRGLLSGTQSSNFFLVSVPPDAYNLESISAYRGPNSILFGAGAPGGLLDSQTKQVRFDKRIFAVEGRYETPGTGKYRATMDINLPLIKDKFGIRLAALYQEGSIDRVPTRDDRRSIYFSSTYRPWAQTVLRANAELGTLYGSKGRSFIAWDWYTPWVAAGRPTVRGAAVPTNTTGLQRLGANLLVKIEGSDLPVMNWALTWRGGQPIVNGVANAAVSFSKNYVVPVATNIAGPDDVVNQSYKNYSAFLEQKLAPNLYLEVAGSYEDYQRYQFDAIRGLDYAIQVDANELLPDGRANPNVGLPYVEGSSQTLYGADENYAYQSRATLSYELNLTDRKVLGVGLGRYKLAGIGSYWRSIFTSLGGQEINTTPAPGFPAALDNAANRIHRRFYLRPGGPQYFVSKLEPIIQAAGGNAATPAVNSAQIHSLALPRYETDELASIGMVAQGFLFKDRLVGTYGVRRDDSSIRGSFFSRASNGIVAPFEARVPNVPTTTSVDTQSVGGVLHLNRQVSLFANRSDNFRPPSGSIFNIYGVTVTPSSGVGTDYGVKLRLFDDRLTASLGTYTNSQKGVYSSADTVTNRGVFQAIWNAIDASKAPPSGWNASRDAVSKGQEVEVIYNPTAQWRVAFNAARNINQSSNLIPEILQYVAQYRPLWEANSSLPAPNAANTIAVQLVALDKSIQEILAQQGNRRLGEREWSTNMVTSYRFAERSKLKGWTVGSVASWRSDPVIGFRQDASGKLTSTNPFFGKSQFLLDSWLGYRRRIREKDWSVQFRVKNLLDYNDPYVIRALDDGKGNAVPATILVPQTRAFSLSVGVSL